MKGEEEESEAEREGDGKERQGISFKTEQDANNVVEKCVSWQIRREIRLGDGGAWVFYSSPAVEELADRSIGIVLSYCYRVEPPPRQDRSLH